MVIALLGGKSAQADQFNSLFRGARAAAMGNAFTAVADDEEALFYNPAGLAGIQGFSFHLFDGMLDTSNDLISDYPNLNTAFKNANVSSLNALMGKDIYARGTAISAVVLPGFEFALLYDQQIAILEKNEALPQSTFGAQTTYGAQMGFGIPVHKFRRHKGEIYFGISGKLLWRAGGYQNVDLSQLMTDNLKPITSNLTNFGSGEGLDAGLMYVRTFKKRFKVKAALAMTDIGTTSFTSGADPINSNLTAGVAGVLESQDMTATLSYDYSHILDYADWRMKTHMGLELKFPLLSLEGGLNELSPTYGAGLDLGMFKFMFVSYAEEQGVLAGQDSERRTLIYLSMKLDL